MTEYTTCRMCDGPLPAALREFAASRFERMTCSTECTRADLVARFGCCAEATLAECVCAYAFECAEHGMTHVGTHD
ncbi:MAG: hypothetical protein JSV86_16955 [Gemmatimonadota bacterium]|nr:MAG: hypothetical protein JSV86_16955 [Gemmatimonadota bacterium]